mgnify:FL=1
MYLENGIEIEELTFEDAEIKPEPKKTSESRMNKTDEVENIKLSVDGQTLSIEVDLGKEIGLTKRGKISIATSHGNKHYNLSDDHACFLSLTVYKK